MALKFWNFELRNTPPLKSFGDKKSLKKKGHKHHPKKKARALPFALAR
jgi:hypothetical protein